MIAMGDRSTSPSPALTRDSAHTSSTPMHTNGMNAGYSAANPLGGSTHHPNYQGGSSSGALNAIPKCVCGWKNCRAYQKTFRDGTHPILDGVIRLKFATDHPESMALKASIDRCLRVPAAIATESWKPSGRKAGQEVCRYYVARHHWTEKHMRKYLADPKDYSFLKPFSIHGAKKYLFAVDKNETYKMSDGVTSPDPDQALYLQCPNVPKEVVKAEFMKVREKMVQDKSNQKSLEKHGTTTSNDPYDSNGPEGKQASSRNLKQNGRHETIPEQCVVSKDSLTVSTARSDYPNGQNHSSSTHNSHHQNGSSQHSQHTATGGQQVHLLKQKEDENRHLKDQLESMKSQLTFLHDMVRRLQEEHFDHMSVRSGRSKHSTTASVMSTRNRNRNGGGYGGASVSTRSGVPKEIELGEDDNDQVDGVRNSLGGGGGEGGGGGATNQYRRHDSRTPSRGGPSNRHPSSSSGSQARGHRGGDWNESSEWTDNFDEYDDEAPTDTQEDDDDDETTATFQVTYQAARRFSNGSRASKGASTIVSASKSVKTLPREIELDEDEDDSESHESLEDEAFDGRSFASTHNGGSSLHGRHGPAFGSSGHTRSDHSRASGPSAMKSQPQQSIGPNSKKPHRRTSLGGGAGAGSIGPPRSSVSVGPGDDTSVSTNGGGGGGTSTASSAGVYHVTAMVVTDPYGEKGTYTGTISNATGMPHGRGRLEYDREGRWYEGDWKHGRWTGYGHLSNGDGDFYEGGLKNDHKHGYGKMRFADGRTFEGEYINGQMIEGKMTYQDGSTYSGSWVDGMRHGFGRCVFTDRSIYEGEFREGEFYGHGKMTWSDGGHYVGEWWNGEMHGKGKEVRPDGSLRHDGQWSKGQPIRK